MPPKGSAELFDSSWPTAYHVGKLWAFCAFYVLCNFCIFLFLPWLYCAYHGSRVCQALVVLTVIDYAVPLPKGHRGIWINWCRACSIAQGTSAYFGADLVVESELRCACRAVVDTCVSHSSHALAGATRTTFSSTTRTRSSPSRTRSTRATCTRSTAPSRASRAPTSSSTCRCSGAS